jgi:hypothetical protein
MVLGLAAPAQAATVTAEVHIVSVGVNDRGTLKVVGELTCPTGYGFALRRSAEEWVTSHIGTRSVSRYKRFRHQVECSGAPDEFVLRYAGDGWAPGIIVNVFVEVDLFDPEHPDLRPGKTVSEMTYWTL